MIVSAWFPPLSLIKATGLKSIQMNKPGQSKLSLRKDFGRVFVLFCLLAACPSSSSAWPNQRPTSVSVLDFGNSNFSKLAAERLRTSLKSEREVLLFDPELTRAAARGVGYEGSLNMSVGESRDLGAAIASDFYIIGDAQTLRRSPSNAPIYYESYCSLLMISSRTGRLVFWDRPSFRADTAPAAETLLLSQLALPETRHRCLVAMRRAQENERSQRDIINDASTVVFEDAPDENKASSEPGLQLPRPYRRLRPEYPESAARAEAEGTVDVLVDIDADGEVGQVQIARWAGFGLDEATVATVRQLHFFPAMRNGTAVPMRVLLRYNFRKPPK
jgi:protein TonB